MSTPTNTDTLTRFAQLLALLGTQFNEEQFDFLGEKMGLEYEQIEELFDCAETITTVAKNAEYPQAAITTLERSPEDPDIFKLTGQRAAWIGIEDPKNPGRGFDIRINEAGDGPVIDVWMMNDADIPGASERPVPLDPIASYGFAFSDYLEPRDDESDAEEVTRRA